MKKIMKSIATLLVVFMALALLLSGCGGKVTAQSLLDGVKKKDGPYIGMSLSMRVVSGEGANESVFEVTTDYESSQGVLHMDNLKSVISSGEMSFDMTGEVWADNEYTYSNMSVFGQDTGWQREASDGEEISTAGVIDGLVNGNTDAVLMDPMKGEDYVVTWTLNMDDVNEAFGGMANTVGLDSVKQDMKVYANFDYKTKELKSLYTGLDSVDGNDAVTSLDIRVEFKEIGTNKTLEIPGVIVDKDYSDQDFGFEIDDGYLGDGAVTGG